MNVCAQHPEDTFILCLKQMRPIDFVSSWNKFWNYSNNKGKLNIEMKENRFIFFPRKNPKNSNAKLKRRVASTNNMAFNCSNVEPFTLSKSNWKPNATLTNEKCHNYNGSWTFFQINPIVNNGLVTVCCWVSSSQLQWPLLIPVIRKEKIFGHNIGQPVSAVQITFASLLRLLFSHIRCVGCFPPCASWWTIEVALEHSSRIQIERQFCWNKWLLDLY